MLTGGWGPRSEHPQTQSRSWDEGSGHKAKLLATVWERIWEVAWRGDVLVSLSVPVMKHSDQKQGGEGGAYFRLYLLVTAHHCEMLGQELKTEA